VHSPMQPLEMEPPNATFLSTLELWESPITQRKTCICADLAVVFLAPGHIIAAQRDCK